jgi:hypothetical protein
VRRAARVYRLESISKRSANRKTKSQNQGLGTDRRRARSRLHRCSHAALPSPPNNNDRSWHPQQHPLSSSPSCAVPVESCVYPETSELTFHYRGKTRFRWDGEPCFACLIALRQLSSRPNWDKVETRSPSIFANLPGGLLARRKRPWLRGLAPMFDVVARAELSFRHGQPQGHHSAAALSPVFSTVLPGGHVQAASGSDSTPRSADASRTRALHSVSIHACRRSRKRSNPAIL